MMHEGCANCKYELEDVDGEYCTGCKHNAVDKFELITNGDRIRRMSDEQLALDMFKISDSGDLTVCTGRKITRYSELVERRCVL